MKVTVLTEIQVPEEATKEQAKEWIERELSLLTAIRAFGDTRDEPLTGNPLSEYEVEWETIRMKAEIK